MLLGCHCAEIIPIEPDMVIHVRKMTKSTPYFIFKLDIDMRIFIIAVLFLVSNINYAQIQNDTIKLNRLLKELEINASLADKKTPISFTNIKKIEIDKINFGKDIPYIIENTPSIVSSSDAGTGIGYTNFRLRGSDQTRINVTINGIPINDSESQCVWWVNMPDLVSSVDE